MIELPTNLTTERVERLRELVRAIKKPDRDVDLEIVTSIMPIESAFRIPTNVTASLDAALALFHELYPGVVVQVRVSTEEATAGEPLETYQVRHRTAPCAVVLALLRRIMRDITERPPLSVA